jgi:hypothetical protein
LGSLDTPLEANGNTPNSLYIRAQFRLRAGADQSTMAPPPPRPRRAASTPSSRQEYTNRRNESVELKQPPDRPVRQRRPPNNPEAPHQDPARSRAAPASKSKPRLYEVRAILDSRTVPDGKTEYLVSWVGYPNGDTWEPTESLKEAPTLLAEFKRRHCQPPEPPPEPIQPPLLNDPHGLLQ